LNQITALLSEGIFDAVRNISKGLTKKNALIFQSAETFRESFRADAI
jgi:hypothetical protein